MVSSLAAQLAQNASLNTAFLSDKSRRKAAHSYLFSSREADHHDLESIHALGLNGFLQLTSLEPLLRKYEQTLFSDAAKTTDRTLLPEEGAKKIDLALEGFLPLLGPYLLESPTGRVLEWLVRRFRINEFNVAPVLSLFLPYHESPHFAKMLSILYIQEASPFSPLLPFKTTTTPLSKAALVTIVLSPTNTAFARFVAERLSLSFQAGAAPSLGTLHRGLIAFHTGILLEFLTRLSGNGDSGRVDENILAWFLPAVMDPLEACSSIEVEPSKSSLVLEVILSSYLLLAALSNSCQLSAKAISAILKAVASSASAHPGVGAKHVIRTVVCVCAGQGKEKIGEQGVISKKVVKAILKLENVEEELVESLRFSNSEHFIEPFLTFLVSSRLHNDRAFKVVSSILTHHASDSTTSLPPSLVYALTKVCLDNFLQLCATSSDDERGQDEIRKSRVRSILVDVQQRYPKVWDKVFAEVHVDRKEGSDNEGEDDDDEHENGNERKDNLDKVLVLLSVDVRNPEQAEQEIDLVVGAAGADANVRALAVKEIYEKLESDGGLDQTELNAIQFALLARVQDTSLPVIEALYSNPKVLTRVVVESGLPEYIENVSAILRDPSSSSKEGREIVKAHVDFVITHLLLGSNESGEEVSDEQTKGDIFYKIVFPLLLFTKPRRRTARMVWELLGVAEKAAVDAGRAGVYEALGGCVDAVAWEEGQGGGGERNMGVFVKINLAVASKIAENIISSDSFSGHLAHVLSTLQQSGEAHGRSLAYAITRVLLSRLSGGHQVDVALQVIKSLSLETLEGADALLKAGESLQSSLDDASIGTAIYLKPSSRNTLLKLQSSLLALTPTILKPSGINLDWLAGPCSIPSETEDTRALNYVQLARNVYRLAAMASSTSSMLSAYLTQSLFVSLSSDALAFLAGVWLNSPDSMVLRYTALRHAAAFLEAHVSLGCCIDFQTVLPSVLVMVGEDDAKVRGAAVECLDGFVRASSQEVKKPSGVYAFDTIYGSCSGTLQYLDWGDFVKYVQTLGEMKEHFLNDPLFVRVFHEQFLKSQRTNTKKEASFKKRVLCYLVSHANSCPLISVKTSLLGTLEGVSNAVKLRMLIPTIQDVLKPTSGALGLSGQEEYIALLVTAFDESAANGLNNGGSWDVYTQVLRQFFQPGVPSRPRKVMAHNLQRGLQSALSVERRVELCQLLLEFCQRDQDIAGDCRELITSLVSDSVVTMLVLKTLQPPGGDSPERASKRARVDTSVEDDDASAVRAASLATFAEIISGASVIGSLDLITSLLETLTRVVHDESQGGGEKAFATQILMSALENVAANMTGADMSDITPQTLRLDILVELIRVSQNPQTFNQALLLAATLARLAPNAVLHNIMPIFTFMGSNVFHRDDTYSFKVVQKTIESIVPVMVSSLKGTDPSGLDLWVASRAFLRLFTDASNHIPRHRRTSFFSQLVDALGPQDFLAPICMLLVDKVANRVVRQNDADALHSLGLSLILMQRYELSIQLSAILELLRESKRLVELDSTGENGPVTLLEPTSDDDRGVETTARRQAQSLLVFVGHSLKALTSTSVPKEASNEQLTSEILLLLIDLGSPNHEIGDDLGDVAKVARSSIINALSVMTAAEFIRGTLVILQSSDALAQKGALELFAVQLPNVTPKVRADITPTVIKIVTAIHKPLLSPIEDSLASLSFRALESIATSMCTGEESVLSNTVPQVLSFIRERKALLDALKLLRSLVTKLGPRIIPYFKDIVKLCASVLRDQSGSADNSVSAVNILQALLSSIPRFWGNTELTLVINVYLEGELSVSRTSGSQMATFIKNLTKKAPAKVLLPLLCEMWKPLSSDTNEAAVLRLPSYFNVFKKALRVAARPVVADHLRSLFATFLSVFQFCASTPTTRESVENQAISTFLELVVKLNEAAFKPFFRRLFDWAFASETTGDEKGARKTIFCHIFSALLDHFKGLMTSYMSFLLPSFISTLTGFDDDGDEDLWLAILQVLTRSFTHDDGIYWRIDKLLQLSKPLIAQLVICTHFNTPETKAALTDCLLAFLEVISDDALLKSTNIDILMHTRSDDSRLRLFALTCSEALWRAHGGKLLGFVHETTTFIAEAAEDENDTVVKEAHVLKNTIESIAGPLDI